ncbi:unnamed protein product [Orchesella dallaii]|uniref:Uncharacterized protein n=1 Tax=Orchesella dallaii TaxID=48710 RepID=A0ABP1S6Y3_9HEXA
MASNYSSNNSTTVPEICNNLQIVISVFSAVINDTDSIVANLGEVVSGIDSGVNSTADLNPVLQQLSFNLIDLSYVLGDLGLVMNDMANCPSDFEYDLRFLKFITNLLEELVGNLVEFLKGVLQGICEISDDQSVATSIQIDSTLRELALLLGNN